MPASRRWTAAAVLTSLCLVPRAAAQGTRPALEPSAVRALVEHAFQAFKPVGLAFALVQGDQVTLELGLGRRKVGGNAAITPHSLFNIASCTKAFTALCIAKLVTEGKLNWDDRVVDLVPEFRLADPWITHEFRIRDLLCHRSGLKTFAGDLLWYGTDYDDAAVLARLDRLPITERFREQFGYQNLMYLVAGSVIERISGLTWSEYLRQTVLSPLGMSETWPANPGTDTELALPHIDGEATRRYHFVACKPAGAIWSSVSDMTHWMRMLMADGQWDGKQIVSAAAIHECWAPHTNMPGRPSAGNTADFSSYGLGWFLSVQGDTKMIEHDGGMPGYISKVTLLPADRLGFVVLNNDMNGLVNLAIRRAVIAQRAGRDGIAVIDRLAARGAAINRAKASALAARVNKRQSDTRPSLPLERYAGRYVDPVLGPAELRWDGKRLEVTVQRSAKTLYGELRHWHFDVFRVDFPDSFLPFALLRFTIDSKGEVDGFTIDCPIGDFDFGALRFRRES